MNVRDLVAVEWPAPPTVRAFSTRRTGGASPPPFASLNLSTATGDDPARVTRNVALLQRVAGLPHAPRWPRQVHGSRVAEADSPGLEEMEADAVVTAKHDVVCTVRSADCLTVLFCDRDASCVGASHAGWRGLAHGVLEATVEALPAFPDRLMAWLGPAIGPAVYEVGDEVRDAFVIRDGGATACFRPSPAGRWLADLPALARRRLADAGVTSIHGCGLCTHDNGDQFFSHRRDGPVTGRQASGVWIVPDA